MQFIFESEGLFWSRLGVHLSRNRRRTMKSEAGTVIDKSCTMDMNLQWCRKRLKIDYRIARLWLACLVVTIVIVLISSVHCNLVPLFYRCCWLCSKFYFLIFVVSKFVCMIWTKLSVLSCIVKSDHRGLSIILRSVVPHF